MGQIRRNWEFMRRYNITSSTSLGVGAMVIHKEEHKICGPAEIDRSFTINNFSQVYRFPEEVVAVQNDKKIIVPEYEEIGLLRRWNPDGSIDNSFTPPRRYYDVDPFYIKSINIQNDGKIIVCGNIQLINPFSQKYIIRLNPNGTVDESFRPNIEEYLNISIVQLLHIVSLVYNDKIIIAGNIYPPYLQFVMTLNQDGSLYGLNTFPFRIYDISIQNGKIIVLGEHIPI